MTPDGIVAEKTWAVLNGNVLKTDSKCVDPCVIYHPIDIHISRKTRDIKYLVIHYTAGASSSKGTAERTRNVFLSR